MSDKSYRLETSLMRISGKLFHQFVETLTAFDGLRVDEVFLLFFEPPSINERVLFPGLDGSGLWLKRHYRPKMQHIKIKQGR